MLTIDHIRDLGYDVDELAPRIFLISNFATPEEVDALYAEASTATEEEWSSRYLGEMRKHAREKFGRDDIEQLVREGLLEVTEDFADKNLAVANDEIRHALQNKAAEIFDAVGGLEVTGFIVHQRLYAGTRLIEHFDQYSDKLVTYAAVLYINDDYVDGEVFFPQHDLKLRPKPGSLLIFPGTNDYVHGVHQVGEGPVRYVLPAFIKLKHPDGPMAGWANFG